MELAWGYRYALVEPDYYRVEYSINPFMDPAVQPNPVLAREQWENLVAGIERLGGRVEVVPARPDSPDMTYAMNLGFAVVSEEGAGQVVLSHMRYPQRRLETLTAREFFASHEFFPMMVGEDGAGPHFEAGDVFPFAGMLVSGYGPRSDKAALDDLADLLGVEVRGFKIVHPAMYHMDLAFCPLSEKQALVCPAAFDEASAAALLDLIPEPLVLTEEEALTTFCANSIVIGRAVVMPACPDRVRAQLEAWGFEIVVVDVSEFHKGGGSIRCLTNPLDITIGRDVQFAGAYATTHVAGDRA